MLAGIVSYDHAADMLLLQCIEFSQICIRALTLSIGENL